jgi:hypothetical protein
VSPFVNGRQHWRLSIKATCWSDSGPNRIPGSRREISRARSKLPPLHGGGRGGLGLGALLGGPSLGVGQIGVGARRGRSFLSAWAHGRSRRCSVLATSWGVSCPNGVARDRRGTSCASPHSPPLHGGRRGGLGRRVLSVSRRSVAAVPRRGRPFLSHGAAGPSRAICAPHTLARPPSAERGGRGPPRGSPGGAPRALNGRRAGRRGHARVMGSTSKMCEKLGSTRSRARWTRFWARSR